MEDIKEGISKPLMEMVLSSEEEESLLNQSIGATSDGGNGGHEDESGEDEDDEDDEEDEEDNT